MEMGINMEVRCSRLIFYNKIYFYYIIVLREKIYKFACKMKDLFFNLILRVQMIFMAIPAAKKSVVKLKKQEKLKAQICIDVERIFDDYGNAILRMAYTYLHNMSDAEDILQDTLIKYMQLSPVFQSCDHEKAWVFRVAVNLSKNKIDYNKLRDTDELDETLVASQREDLSFVWEAVKELPVAYREVIHLYYYEGFSSGEIASILHSKESTVRSNLKRGREKLKEILKEAYDFE